jgi:hypothetical protein
MSSYEYLVLIGSHPQLRSLRRGNDADEVVEGPPRSMDRMVARDG